MSEHELWNELGNLYFLSGSYDGAVHAYHRAITLDPEVGEPYSNLAQTYVQMGQYTEAVTFYQQGIALLADVHEKATSLHKLGDVYLHLKEYPRAVEAYQQAEGLISDLHEESDNGQSTDRFLHCRPKEGIPSQAPLAAASSPASSSGMELLPFIEELTPWWFESQSAPEEEPEPNYDLSPLDDSGVAGPDGNIIFTEPLKWDDVTAYQTSPVEHNAIPLNQTGVAAMTPESVAAGVESYNQERTVVEVETLVAEPEPVMAIANAPEVITEAPDFSVPSITSPEAVQYETPVELPMVALSQHERTFLLADIEKFKRVLEINPRNAFAWDTIGGNYKTLGKYDDALHAFQQAVRLDPTKAFYFHHLGLVYAAVGRMDDAIAAFERVISIDPNHGLAHATLGGYYRKNGNEELAQKHIEKARNLLGADENEYNRACLEAICGNTERSLELLEIALKNRQTYVNWARDDPDLDFIRNDPRFHTLLTRYATQTSQ
jgi:tetratricopeptide (TPR) repeat protein